MAGKEHVLHCVQYNLRFNTLKRNFERFLSNFRGQFMVKSFSGKRGCRTVQTTAGYHSRRGFRAELQEEMGAEGVS